MKGGACEIALNLKYDIYEKGLATVAYKFSNKVNFPVSKVGVKTKEWLAQELHKPLIKNLKKKIVVTVYCVLIPYLYLY